MLLACIAVQPKKKKPSYIENTTYIIRHAGLFLSSDCSVFSVGMHWVLMIVFPSKIEV